MSEKTNVDEMSINILWFSNYLISRLKITSMIGRIHKTLHIHFYLQITKVLDVNKCHKDKQCPKIVRYLNFLTALLRYISHTIQITPLKWTTQWFLVHSQIEANHHHSRFWNIFITSKSSPLFFSYHLPIFSSTPPTSNLLSVFINVPILDISYLWNQIIICGLL